MHDSLKLSCPGCGYTSVCGAGAMLDWLRSVRMVRRGATVEADLLRELFRAASAKFTCPGCGGRGLVVRPPADEDNEAWGMARRCEACGRPIDRERTDALPEVRLCAACQSSDERGESSEPAGYCPTCGGVMIVRPSRGAGLTRYKLDCPKCRR